MGYDSPDLYNQPEAFGLAIVGEAEDATASYSFNMFVVWQDKDGKLYWLADSGCSCPSPFEDARSIETASTGTAAECDEAISEWAVETGRYGHAEPGATELRTKVAAL